MKKITCDITLKGSTKKYIDFNLHCCEQVEFIKNLEFSIPNKSKTTPAKMAKRVASLIQFVYQSEDYDEQDTNYILGCINQALCNLETKLSRL